MSGACSTEVAVELTLLHPRAFVELRLEHQRWEVPIAQSRMLKFECSFNDSADVDHMGIVLGSACVQLSCCPFGPYADSENLHGLNCSR